MEKLEARDTELEDFMKSKWLSLCNQLDLQASFANHWWDRFEKLFDEEQRFYHTLRHVRHLLSLRKKYATQYTDNEIVFKLSAWFHDAIYEPTRGDNEERSAELFDEFAKPCSDAGKISIEDRKLVYDIIIATKKHVPFVTPSEDARLHRQCAVFLDCDIAILGAPDAEYDEYAESIRKEYAHYSDESYAKGRKAVLEGFIEKEHLFITQEFQRDFEEQARVNLHREIKNLSVS